MVTVQWYASPPMPKHELERDLPQQSNMKTHRFHVTSAFLVAIEHILGYILSELWVLFDQIHQGLTRNVHQLCRGVHRRLKSVRDAHRHFRYLTVADFRLLQGALIPFGVA